MPRLPQACAIASTGCSEPVSLLAQITLTSRVSGRSAAATAAASTQPAASGATRVTVTPCASSERRGSSTEGCSTAVVTTWSPGRSQPRISVLFASVAPAVKQTAAGSVPSSAATCARAVSSAARAREPSS